MEYAESVITHWSADESKSLYTGRFDTVEDINHPLCLQFLNLWVEAEESPTTTTTITDLVEQGIGMLHPVRGKPEVKLDYKLSI